MKTEHAFHIFFLQRAIGGLRRAAFALPLAWMLFSLTPAHGYGLTECAASRFGSNLNCTANDVSITGISLAPGTNTTCQAGENLVLDLILTVNFASPSRYDVGIFVANDGKNPQLLASSGGASSCSVAVLPTTSPFLDLNSNACGDGNGSINGGAGSGQLAMNNVSVPCATSSTAGGKLQIPFVVSWSQNAGSVCSSAADPVPSTTSKCNAFSGSDAAVDIVVVPTMTITDSVTTVNPGDSTSYTVTITNTTGIVISGAVFSNPAVTYLTVDSISCIAAGGASCPALGGGAIGSLQGAGITLPDLPVNGSLTFTINTTVSGSASGTIVNAANLTLGGQTNTVTDSNTVIIPLDHYELSLATSSLTCQPATLTVTACADASSPCTNPATNISGKTAALATSAGTLGAGSVSFNASGVATTTLAYPAAADNSPATVTLSAEEVVASSPRKCCPDGVSCVVANSCTTTFNTAGFVFSTATAGGSDLPVQTAGVTAPVAPATYYLRAVKTATTTGACQAAITGSRSVNLAYECTDPTTCSGSNLLTVNADTSVAIARNNSGSVTGYSAVGMTFDANGNAPFTFNYADVGRVKLWANTTVNAATLSGSSNSFVVKPFGFTLSTIRQTAAPQLANPGAANATGARFVQAGEAFSVTATATTASGAAAPNYGRETAAETVRLTPVYAGSLGLTGTVPAIGGSFDSFANGVASGTAFAWNDVGIIRITPSVGDGDYLGAGDVAGTQSGNVGRFYASRFLLTNAALVNRSGFCGTNVACAGFTYLGEPMTATFRLTAVAADGATALQNYSTANQFAKLDPTAAVTAGSGGVMVLGAINDAAPRTPFTPCGAVPAHPCITPLAATGSFVNGVADISLPMVVFRSATAVAPFANFRIGIAPADSDGVILNSYDIDTVNVVAGVNNHRQLATSVLRWGRLWISNAHGSEALRLPVPVTAQYFNGSAFVTNADDDDTQVRVATAPAASDVVFDDYRGALSAVTVVGAVPYIVNYTPDPPRPAGVRSFVLTADASNAGSVRIRIPVQTGAACNALPIPLQCYLPSNDARATFGIYRGNRRLIYTRENY